MLENSPVRTPQASKEVRKRDLKAGDRVIYLQRTFDFVYDFYERKGVVVEPTVSIYTYTVFGESIQYKTDVASLEDGYVYVVFDGENIKHKVESNALERIP